MPAGDAVAGVLLASSNVGKLSEMRRYLAPIPVTTPKELGVELTVVEDGDTLEANARKKAAAYAAAAAEKGFAVLADDTGLEIDALGGEPGIRVRRWVGREMTDGEIVEHCLARLHGVPPERRGAQFRTVLALLPDPRDPARVEFVDGTLRGRIQETAAARKWPGKPFQGLLHVDEWGMLLGEGGDLPAEEKRRKGMLSHRERAMEKLRARLQAQIKQAPAGGEPPAKRSCTASAGANTALLFVKPKAVTPEVLALVRDRLGKRGVRVSGDGFLAAGVIDKTKRIDQHYYAIASKAVLLSPAELAIPAAKFKDAFKEEWADVLKEGRALNATDACAHFGLDDDGMDKAWQAAKKAGRCVKFGGGFYCARIEQPGKEPRYSFNGFYMSMRRGYTVPGTGIHWMTVEWDPEGLSWAAFRAEVLGATDPKDAAEGSLRRLIYDGWQKLGLKERPWVGDNGVHASASPFEALVERQNWLRPGSGGTDATLSDDPFGARLVAAGVSAATLDRWARDPRVRLPGGGEGSLFDAFEDLDAADCVRKAGELAKL